MLLREDRSTEWLQRWLLLLLQQATATADVLAKMNTKLFNQLNFPPASTPSAHHPVRCHH
jgi:hypothetical protein